MVIAIGREERGRREEGGAVTDDAGVSSVVIVSGIRLLRSLVSDLRSAPSARAQ